LPNLSNNVFTPTTGQWSHQQPPQAPQPVGPVPAPVRHDAEDTKLNKLWSFQTRLSLIGGAYRLAEANLPTFTHTIAVSVVGGPKSDMRRIWQLCLSTAFGRYKQGGRTGIQAGNLEATWDITGKSCQVVISYINSGVEGLLSRGGGIGVPTAAIVDPVAGGVVNGLVKQFTAPTTGDFLYGGPTQETVGADTLSWLHADNVYAAALIGAGAVGAVGAFSGGVVGGRLFNAPVAGAKKGAAIGAAAGAAAGLVFGSIIERFKNRPPLPDSNRVITTANKTNPNIQPPAPSGDGVSRTFPYLALVANALTSPCYLPASPPKGAQLEVKTPVYYGTTKSPYDTSNINKVVNGYFVNTPLNLDAAIGAAGGLIAGIQVISKDRKDGYPVMPDKTIVNLQGPTNPGTQ